MVLPPEEPHFGPWQVEPLAAFVQSIQDMLSKDRPGILGIDGRSANGKSTLAALISREVPGSVVVHTDDIAWHHSFFDWSDLFLQEVLEPARAGQCVAYRPSAWIERDREGAVEVPASCSLVILEGVGAGRRELAHAVDITVWVQSDMTQARARGIARDITQTGDDAAAVAFWNEWMTAELVFMAEQRPWERADFIVCGTPEQGHNPTSEVVVARSRLEPR